MKMKIAILFLILAASGCVEAPRQDEVVELEVEPIIDYYSLGGHTGEAGEAFFVARGSEGEAENKLNEIVVQGKDAETVFTQNDALNFVIFRGVFSSGGHGITIDKVERRWSDFGVHATYSDPGKGSIVTQAFTQPAAIIPIGELKKGSYEVKLLVTTIQKDGGGDSIIGEDLEHARVSFVVK